LFFLQSSDAGAISLPGEKFFMSRYMPGDPIYLNPMACHGWGTDGKNKIHHH
jgi:hypothetical protein